MSATEPVKVTRETVVVEHINPAWLRWRREHYARISLREMARLLGCSAPYLSDVERGRRGVTDRLRLAYEDLWPHDTRAAREERAKRVVAIVEAALRPKGQQ